MRRVRPTGDECCEAAESDHGQRRARVGDRVDLRGDARAEEPEAQGERDLFERDAAGGCGWGLGEHRAERAPDGEDQHSEPAEATALVNILLPLVHPRMGSPLTGANATALLEPPGFLMRNYGARTPLVNILAHVAYGALVGGFTQLAS